MRSLKMPFFIKIKSKNLISLLCLLISFTLNSADPNFAGYLFDQPTIDTNFPNELVREADKDPSTNNVEIYNLPPRVWMTFDGKGERNGPDDDDHDWLHYAFGMAGIIGAKLGLSAQEMEQFIKHYGDDGIGHDWGSWTELNDMANAYKPGGKEHKKYFDLYVKGLFKSVIPLAQKIQANYNKIPKTNLSKLESITGITKLDLKNQIDSISLYNRTTFVTTTVPSSRNWSKPRSILDNDILLNTNEQKLNVSENYFRHGFKILTGFIPGWNDIHKKYYNGTNPLNPFDPFDSWGYVTDPLPEIYKKACIFPNGDVLVLGNDCQPYFYEKSTSKVYGYALKYRDGCIDIAAGKTKIAILYRGNLLRIKTYDDAKMNEWKIYNRGITPVSPWNAPRDNINSWGYAYHTHETYQQGVWDWRDTPSLVTKYGSEYSKDNIELKSWDSKTISPDSKLVSIGFDDSVWLVSTDGKILKLKADDSTLDATGASNIVKLSIGNGLAAAIDEAGFLYLCNYTATGTTATFNKTELKTHDCSVSYENGIALIDDKNSVYYLEPMFLQNLASPDIANNSAISLKTDDITATYVDLTPSGVATLSDSGKTFFVEKNPKFNIVTLKAGTGKYLGAHKNNTTITDNTQLMADLESGNVTSVATDEAINSISQGQFVLIKSTKWTSEKKNYLIMERLSKKYIGKINGTNQLGVVGDDAKTIFEITAPIVSKTTDGSVATTAPGNVADFDLFIKSVNSASKLKTTTLELSALESKLVMLGALCQIYVDSESSLEPSSIATPTKTVSTAVCNAFYGKADAPDGLVLADRSLTILKLLDEISDEQTTIDAVISKSGLLLIINKVVRKISDKFSENTEIKELADQINKRFKVQVKASGFAERLSDLKIAFTSITNEQEARAFFTNLENLIKDRVEADSTNFASLKTWIGEMNNKPAELSYMKIIKTAGLQPKLAEFAAKIITPLSLGEAIDRLNRYSTEIGILNNSQQATFKQIFDLITTGTGEIRRISISKNRTQTLLQATTKIKNLNPTINIATSISNINFNDFKVGFISKMRDSIFKSIPANIDTDSNLWKKDSSDPSTTPADAFDTTRFYTLAMIWEDLSCWKEWAPDLTNPANRIPLIMICNQIKDSIVANFSADPKYTTLKADVEKMITELNAGAANKS